MAPLATVTDLEAVLGRTLTTAESTQADMFLSWASSYVRDYTGRTFERQVDHALRTQADSHGVIELPDPPVVSVASIMDIDGETWTPVTGYWDGMWRIDGLRPWHTYIVTYTHGSDVVPDSIKGVVVSMASRQVINPAGIRQETVGATSVTYASVFGEAGALGLSGLERQVLDMYSDVGMSWRL